MQESTVYQDILQKGKRQEALFPKLTEGILHRYATSKTYQRGEDYYRQGAVISLIQRGQTLQGLVEGNEVRPYHVSLGFEGNEIISANCTCAYESGGWCKHIVATLLTCIRQPEKIEERPTLEQLLDCLNEIQLQGLLQDLVTRQPELIESIERYINRIVPPPAQQQPSEPPRRITINPAPYRTQVQSILRDAVRYLEEGWEEDPITDEICSLIQEAQAFCERGEGNNALAILAAITASCVEGWDQVDEYGADNDQLAEALNEVWTEAILCAELTSPEKVDLQVNLEAWQDEWHTDCTISLEALRQGWDYPPLQSVLAGEITHLGAWEGASPDYADDLALIRLKILEHQERYQEYLYLAQAEGQTQQYLTMLGRLGRISEAMQAAQTKMTSMEQAFSLAHVLREKGSVIEALKIAQAGLTLSGNCQYELAIWTSELGEALGDEETALAAIIKAFQAKPSFKDYQKTEELAGEDWPSLKLELLDYLRSYQNWGIEKAKVNIFLDERLIEDAIAVVSDVYFYDTSLIHRVMDAATSERPDWVIENACRRANSIMDAGKAQSYEEAIQWLRKARAAYCQTGQPSQWSTYRTELMQKHARKYKLMAMLKQQGLD